MEQDYLVRVTVYKQTWGMNVIARSIADAKKAILDNFPTAVIVSVELNLKGASNVKG